ncbi:MAG: aminotransferase class IV [Opitutales bacterium]|nr:aminotransferase class IV [Opitutales bacterium]
MASFVQANSNGHLHDARIPSISPLDRSFLYGDSIYEVVRTYDGSLFGYHEHFERLTRSASSLGIVMPFDESVLLTEIRRTVSAFRQEGDNKKEKNLYIRIQISRGAGEIGLDSKLADESFFVILVKALPSEDIAGKKKRGLALTVGKTLVRNHQRTLNPAWKTGNYLNNVLALKEARSKGKDDVIMNNLEGYLTEASTSNLFFVEDKKLITPPLGQGILAGITRSVILEQAAQAWDIAITEENLTFSDLGRFEECFLTSTTKDIVPVRSIDDITYRVGARTLTSRLKKTFRQYVAEYIRRNPLLAVC